MASLILFGALSFREMGVSQLPDVDFPVVSVRANLDGAAPEVMELDVVDPLENALMGIEGVKGISSTARSGSASISIDFEFGKNIDVAVQEIQTKISQAQRSLPKGIDPPIVSKSNPEDQPIVWLAVSSKNLSQHELMAYVRDQIKDQFLTVPGVADVFLGGYVDPNVRVWVSADRLSRTDLTINDITSAIIAEHSEPPSGQMQLGTKEINIRTLGEASTIEELKKLAINRRGGQPNYRHAALGDVARVEDGLADIRSKSRVLGVPAVGLGIRKQRGSNSVDVADGVKKKLTQVREGLPQGTEIGVNFDSTQFIKESIHELNFTLVLSGILTALVCWLFLGSMSATINIVLAIPTSILGTFIFLNALNFTLNTFTLLGLSLAIGIVVDDAIMVLENIVRHYEMGKERKTAAREGAREIAFAALAATAAIMAIFLPVAFMKGLIGKYFFQFGVTISAAVALSLLEALTLTPMRCSQFISVGERKTRIGRAVEYSFHRLSEMYQAVIPWLLQHRLWVIIGSIVFFVSSLFLSGLLKKEFVPPQDQGSLLVRIKASDDANLDYTDKKTLEVEKVLQAEKSVHRYFCSVGGFGGGDVNTSVCFITLLPKDQRKDTQQQIADRFREQLKAVTGVKSFIQDLSLSGFSARRGFPVEFTLSGPEWEPLIEASKKIMAEMEKTGLMVDVDSDYRGGVDEIQIVPDRVKAQARGVSVADIGQMISALYGGALAGKFSKGGHRYDIRVKLEDVERNDLERLKRLLIRNNRGELIPLAEVVAVRKDKGFQAVSRVDRERTISVYSNVAPNVSQEKALNTVREFAPKLVPPGYHADFGGSSESFRESFQSLMFALVLGLIISYMVLASQFNSFIHPITVLVALPFSLSGAYISLYLGNQSINMYSMIGILLLMGIVKKNSILLVDFTNQLRQRGLTDVKEALRQACPMRLRPILMTSFATIVGALPPALAIGPGAETRIPMALVVIGGVLVSTILTLFVVPCMYSYMPGKVEVND